MAWRTFHIGVSVAGSLRQTDRELEGFVTLDNGVEATGHQARQWLRIQQMKGRKLIPVGEPCEGWSYETGCPGHAKEDLVAEHVPGQVTADYRRSPISAKEVPNGGS